MNIREAFEPEGVVAVVGAGGKKSTIYGLAAELGRAVVTTTVRIPMFGGHVERLVITDHPAPVLQDNDEWPVGLVPGLDGDRERYLGYRPATVDEVGDCSDAPVLVKADGARGRWLKAPDEEEPRIPHGTDLVIAVASVRAVGKALDEEHVHRPERVAELIDRDVDEEIRGEDVTTVLIHEDGGLKDVPEDARFVPLLNMVDDADLEATAREIADDLTDHSRVERVVLGRMDLRTVVDGVE